MKETVCAGMFKILSKECANKCVLLAEDCAPHALICCL